MRTAPAALALNTCSLRHLPPLPPRLYRCDLLPPPDHRQHCGAVRAVQHPGALSGQAFRGAARSLRPHLPRTRTALGAAAQRQRRRGPRSDLEQPPPRRQPGEQGGSEEEDEDAAASAGSEGPGADRRWSRARVHAQEPRHESHPRRAGDPHHPRRRHPLLRHATRPHCRLLHPTRMPHRPSQARELREGQDRPCRSLRFGPRYKASVS
mmetsp:Transcript_28185/g.66731  ORF Transcript_28185/g.66731 Transcript_28185/m.66731 type:complete len:209 (+) Transcript_28185:407-1033(+)